MTDDCRVNVAWSTSTDNYSDGYTVYGFARIYLESSVARGNRLSGLYMTGEVATISNFMAIENGVGIYVRGAVYSRQNNTIAANTKNIDGSLVPLPPL